MSKWADEKRRKAPVVEFSERAEARFWSKVVVVENCWEWIGCTTPSGYGQMSGPDRSRPEVAHKVSYRWYGGGEVPAGRELDHTCGNKRCVNPAHLEAVTHRENVVRGNGWASNARKTHCPKGHQLDGVEACRMKGSIGVRRYCKTCKAQRGAIAYRAQRGGK